MEQKEKLLDKVRGLISNADSYEALGNTAAAQTYRDKADQLMTLYAIEAFELEFGKDRDQRLYKPELRDYAYGDVPDEISNTIYRLFSALAELCRVKVGWLGYRRAKVVGYPQDLDYLDILFTSVRLHMSANVRPHASREMGYEASLAILKESGMKWAQIYTILLPLFPERFDRANAAKHKEVKETYERAYRSWQTSYESRPDYAPWEESYYFTNYFVQVGDEIFLREMPRPVGVAFTGQYTRFCEATGRKRIYSDPQVWLRSFVEGYVTEIQNRCWQMKRAQSDVTTGKELVLAGIEGDLNEFFWECFPDLKPHPKDCDCNLCHWCDDPKCKRSNCVAKRKPVRYSSPKERAISYEARARGREAGSKADLSGATGRVGSSGRKELD